MKIDITSGSLDKRPIYAAIGVPEFWHYDGNKLEVFVLQSSDGHYQQVTQSPTFTWMPLDVIPRFIRQNRAQSNAAFSRSRFGLFDL